MFGSRTTITAILRSVRRVNFHEPSTAFNGLPFKSINELPNGSVLSFPRHSKATDYTEYDTTALKDGTVIRMAQHSFFKVSNFGGWISYTGNTHSDEEMAQILKSTIAPIHVYVH